jgi:hypothetical protein
MDRGQRQDMGTVGAGPRACPDCEMRSAEWGRARFPPSRVGGAGPGRGKFLLTWHFAGYNKSMPKTSEGLFWRTYHEAAD